jgi:CPA2 family monovalent cation:H+ antiporter-2
VLCGYGRVGRLAGEVLAGQREPLVVIDYDHEVVVELLGRGIPAVYGDASRRAVLEAAGASRARLAIIALPDGASSAAAISELQTINPSLLVIARAHRVPELEALCQTGADEVVYPEYEAGLEIIQHALLLLGHDQEATREMVGDLRRDGYQRFSCGREGWGSER